MAKVRVSQSAKQLQKNLSAILYDWRPDWRDKNQYPFSPSAKDYDSSIQLAWEFLRRNESYWKLWHELIEPYTKNGEFDNQQANKDTLAGLTESPTGIFIKEFDIISTSPAPPPYWEPHPSGFSFMNTYLRAQHGLTNKDNPENKRCVIDSPDIPNNQMCIWFHLERPIQEQLERTGKILEARRRKLKKEGEIKDHRSKDYMTYLRVLDAKAVSASNEEIAKILYPKKDNDYPDFSGNKAVDNAFRKAKIVRDRDYRYIPNLI